MKLESPAFATFYRANPDFEILDFDFFAPGALASLRQSGVDIAHLQAMQRLLRLYPSPDIRISEDRFRAAEKLAHTLYARGVRSAHKVTLRSERRFIELYGDAFGGHEDLARALYRRAQQVVARIGHVAANVHALTASPHFAATLSNNVDPELTDYFTSVPSYQDLFGTLDFCTCRDCNSIFSPAAYFLDIMRITDRYITDANEGRIPSGWSLPERRPDLFQLKLDCANTNDPVPFLEIVNQVLIARLADDLEGDPFQTLALAPFPFNLPFSLPLARLRLYLERLDTTLNALWGDMLVERPDLLGFENPDIARESLGLSSEQVALVTTPDPSDEGLSASYGFENINDHLPKPGVGRLTFDEGSDTAMGTGVDFRDELTRGRQIQVGNMRRTVVEVTQNILTLDVAWTRSGMDETYTVFALIDLTAVEVFAVRTGLNERQKVERLLVQGLSQAELEAGVADTFFINHTGEVPSNMAFDGIAGDVDNPIARIRGLSDKRLDRLSRFIRLSTITGLPFETLDWLMRATASSEITNGFILFLADLVQLSSITGLSMEETAAFVFEIKDIGKGDEPFPVDLFDRVFNAPELLQGRDPSTSLQPIPFDPARPPLWDVLETTERPTNQGKVQSADSRSITLSESASSEDGAFVGLSVSIITGPGAGQSRVIQSYTGATRVAELFMDWNPRPTEASTYRVGNVPDLVDRLAAALAVKKQDLTLVGRFLQAMLGLGSAPIMLNLQNLTFLFRLTKIPRLYRLTIDEYLNLLTLIFAPDSPSMDPPVGMLTADEGDPAALIAQLQTIVMSVTWLQNTSFSAYSLRYVLTGERSRFLRLPFTDEDIPSFIENLAAVSQGSRVTPATLGAVGLDEAQTTTLEAELIEQGFLDHAGVNLINAPSFEMAASGFPITAEDFEECGVVSPEQAAWAFDTLQLQLPPILVNQMDEKAQLSPLYREQTPLEFLFVAEPDSSQMRRHIASVLDATLADIRFTQYAPLLPVADTAFIGPLMDAQASENVFTALATAPEPVLIANPGDKTGALSVAFNEDSDLSFLFDSPGAGQTRTITSYIGQTRTATVDPPWQTEPGLFSLYVVASVSTSGAARGGGPDTIQLAVSASGRDGTYVAQQIEIPGEDGKPQVRTIVRYVGWKSKTATVDRAWQVAPVAGNPYHIMQPVNEGAARGGGTNTIILSLSASSSDGAFDGMRVRLVADPDQDARINAVREVLLGRQQQILSLTDVLDESLQDQLDSAGSGLGGFVGTAGRTVEALVPWASSESNLRPFLPSLLNPQSGAPTPVNTVDLINGLSRANLMASSLRLTDLDLFSIARRPDFYNIAQTDQLTMSDLELLDGFRSFAIAHEADDGSLPAYFDVSLEETQRKIDALGEITGWNTEQIAQLTTLLWPESPDTGLATLAGVLRLQAPFRAVNGFGADADYLARITALAPLRLGYPGTEVDPLAWAAYTAAADATLSLIGARYTPEQFIEVSEGLRSAVEVAKRNALLDFTIWNLQKTFPSILDSADLFRFLLIDVEMGGCDHTSFIAQGIASVQLYMQRARMGLEPGADTLEIPEIWWEWMSSFRLWEVNRKIFLYPENFIEPSLRKDMSPTFRDLVDELQTGNIDEATVTTAYEDYFEEFNKLASLTLVGAYNTSTLELDGERERAALFLVARTKVTPHEYYWRGWERTSDCDQPAWSPWRKVEATISADEAIPLFAFDRLFLFWVETEEAKSSTVDGGNSSTESVSYATLRYTFPNLSGSWVAPQAAGKRVPIVVAPNDDDNLKDPFTADKYNPIQQYFRRPYVQRIARGIPGAGTLTLREGERTAQGANSDLESQVKPGDRVWVAGQRRRVTSVSAEQRLTVSTPWIGSATDVGFKVIPRNPDTTRFPPFIGDGVVLINKAEDFVEGVFGTNFSVQVQVGDNISIMDETRTVVEREAEKLTVNRPWSESTPSKPGLGTVAIPHGSDLVRGDDRTRFTEQFVPGDIIFITLNNEMGVVVDVANDHELTVQKSFTLGGIRLSYLIRRSNSYQIIPRTDGSERLLALYGPGLDSKNLLVKKYEHEPNPGDDPFIAAKNEFNQSLSDALVLVTFSLDGLPNVVSGLASALLGVELTEEPLRVVSAAYTPNAGASVPVRAGLVRASNRLQLERSDNLLVDAYWGNSKPGTTAFQPFTNRGRALMFHLADQVNVYNVGNQVGAFLVDNIDQAFLLALNDPNAGQLDNAAFIRPFKHQVTPLPDMVVEFGPYTTSDIPFDEMTVQASRLTTSVAPKLKQRLFAGGLERLLTPSSQTLLEPPFSDFFEDPGGAPPPALDPDAVPPSQMDFNGAYGLYFWEIFFHAPLLVADRLRDNRRFSEARSWYQFIFNPTANPDPDDKLPSDRFWRFVPFRTMDIPSLTDILTNQCQINAFNDDPFDPDAIARLRISAYAKTTLIKYIDNLIRWADAQFTVDTRESINEALNLYVLAQDLLGEKPVSVGECPVPDPLDFDEIKEMYPDGVPQFLIQMENSPFGGTGSNDGGFTFLPWNAVDSYFCVPENKELVELWDRIEDRLFKIRHCLNINGVARPLPLFAPPLDPRAVIQSFGDSESGFDAASFGGLPVPRFRFEALVAQARSVAADVIRRGSDLLNALERKDAEALATLQLSQQAAVLELTTSLKQQRIDELAAMQQATEQSLEAARTRKSHFQRLLNFPLSAPELLQLSSLGFAINIGWVSANVETASAIAANLPQVGSPFAMTFGGIQISSTLEKSAEALAKTANINEVFGKIMELSAAWQRRGEEWTLQRDLARIDEKQIKAQLEAVNIQSDMAQQELRIHNTQIAQNRELQRFYHDKFTNEALYNWLIARISSTYFQAYTTAIELARMAERAFQFQAATQKRYIGISYWDSLHQGLTAGDGLMLALDQMEAAWKQNVARPLEIRRTISLQQIDPLAFASFVKTGKAVFAFTERLFDRDYPGFYRRQIKTLSVTINPPIASTSEIKATLTQTSNAVVSQPDIEAVEFLLGLTDQQPPSAILMVNQANFQKIALSTGQQDNGLFSVGADSAQFLPFEGTGAVSAWELSMPPENNSIDIGAITEVISELQYQALDGGSAFAQRVASLPPMRERDNVQMLKAAREQPVAWRDFLESDQDPRIRSLRLGTPPLSVPNVASSALASLYLLLVTAPGVDVSAQEPYITIDLGDGRPIEVMLSSNGDFMHVLDPEIPVKRLSDTIDLCFDLTRMPIGLKDADSGRLDPTVMRDILLVFFTRGQV